MARRVSLPITDKLLESLGPPTLAAMRAKLGGRVVWTSAPGDALRVGAIVSLLHSPPQSAGDPLPSTGEVPSPDPAATTRLGVVLALSPIDADVYLTRGMVKRTLASLLTLHAGDVPAELAAIRPSIEAFARLEEQQEIWFDRGNGEISEGVLIEKCRYGALVGDRESKVLGVGFRKLFDKPPILPGAN
jgi:hypothetical protein